MKTDSKEGIACLIQWAKEHGYVLAERHKRLAIKYGVPIDGMKFSEKVPTK